MSLRDSVMSRRVRVAGLAIAMAASVAVTSGSAEAAKGPFASANDLLSASAPAKADRVTRTPRNVAAARLATLNGSLLSNRLNGKRINFNLLPGVKFTGVATQVGRQLGMTTWYGKLDNKAGHFYAARSGSVLQLTVVSPKGVWEVSNVGGSTYRVVRINQNAIKEDAKPESALIKGKLPKQLGSKDRTPGGKAAADTGAYYDVMVSYSNQSLTGEGSEAALKARIANAVNETNVGYANSGVTTRARLVHIQNAGYNEVGDFSTDLARFAGTSDGYMDSLHTLRNRYGADIMVLILESQTYCGLADAILATSATAFATVSRSCATGYFSFGHEIGHLQGARHDTYVDPTSTPYSYGHGFVDVTNRFRTIMSYNNRCAASGVNCTRIDNWSNPARTYLGHVTGTSITKNYQVLNNTASYIANLRTQIIGPNWYSSFNGSRSGWYDVRGTFSTTASYLYSTGAPNTGTSVRAGGTYGDFQFEARMYRTGLCVTCANRVLIRGLALNQSTGWWHPSYMVQWTNDGMYSVYFVNSAGASSALIPWRATSAIVKNGWNVIKVRAVNGWLRVFINNVYVGAVYNTSLITGSVGLGFYRDSNTGTLYTDYASMTLTPALMDANRKAPTSAKNKAIDVKGVAYAKGGTANKVNK